ncbi:MAG TPA: queuosine precursor transporter [Aggregatilineales bacterium]|nr:queuosine precursor transporter [Anaerolineales bacterium]HRE47432.1 queuosine precursor transporter [Aggregatilineales bacterium]
MDQPQPRLYRYIDFITASFVAVLIISNIASTKTVIIGSLTFDGGTVIFPLAYIFGDVLTEVYGYKRARRVIWTGFLWIIVTAGVLAIIDALPPEPFWNQIEGITGFTKGQGFSLILGQAPRIVLGSLIAYFAGEFTNSFILAKMKIATKGRALWTRTIGSTLVGQFVDTSVFLVVAFYGVFPNEVLLTIFVSNYIFKVSVEALFTPVTYAAVRFLKRAEAEDYYDTKTNFNPFALR